MTSVHDGSCGLATSDRPGGKSFRSLSRLTHGAIKPKSHRIKENLHPEPCTYWEYNPDSAGTRRDECLVGDSRRQVLVDGDKGIEVVQE